jgi:hypothetical protein
MGKVQGGAISGEVFEKREKGKSVAIAVDKNDESTDVSLT